MTYLASPTCLQASGEQWRLYLAAIPKQRMALPITLTGVENLTPVLEQSGSCLQVCSDDKNQHSPNEESYRDDCRVHAGHARPDSASNAAVDSAVCPLCGAISEQFENDKPEPPPRVGCDFRPQPSPPSAGAFAEERLAHGLDTTAPLRPVSSIRPRLFGPRRP